jgi:hypothetical protein
MSQHEWPKSIISGSSLTDIVAMISRIERHSITWHDGVGDKTSAIPAPWFPLVFHGRCLSDHYWLRYFKSFPFTHLRASWFSLVTPLLSLYKSIWAYSFFYDFYACPESTEILLVHIWHDFSESPDRSVLFLCWIIPPFSSFFQILNLLSISLSLPTLHSPFSWLRSVSSFHLSILLRFWCWLLSDDFGQFSSISPMSCWIIRTDQPWLQRTHCSHWWGYCESRILVLG